jgi:hypothetical protein
MTFKNITRSFILLLWGLQMVACTVGQPVLSGVRFAPHTTISPNADLIDDITELFYSIGQPSLVTIAFEDGAGNQYLWREGERRPAGDYQVLFGGVIDGQVLPNGTYTVTITAAPENGTVPQSNEITLTIADGDSNPPEIQNFTVTPQTITPNRDGVSDVATVSYALSKEGARLSAYLLSPEGERYPLPPDLLREPTDAGGHTQLFDGGVSLGAVPPPDGDYTLWLEMWDEVGASDRVSTTLTLENGGLPLVQITRHDVDFSTTTLLLGDTLYFTTTVTNVGDAPIRTHGSEPGTVYNSTENYNNLNEPIRDGAFRLGLDFEGNPVYNGQRYPYRWQLGTTAELTEIEGHYYLMPNQEVTITGGLTLLELPPRQAPGFWVGLIHENVRFVEDFVGTEYIPVEAPTGAPTIMPTE